MNKSIITCNKTKVRYLAAPAFTLILLTACGFNGQGSNPDFPTAWTINNPEQHNQSADYFACVQSATQALPSKQGVTWNALLMPYTYDANTEPRKNYFNACMAARGYTPADKSTAIAVQPVAPASAPSASYASNLFSDANDQIAYCLGADEAAVAMMQNLPESVHQHVLQKDPNADQTLRQLTDKVKQEIVKYKTNLTAKGLYADDQNKIPQDISVDIELGAEDGKANLQNFFNNQGALQCNKMCQKSQASNPSFDQTTCLKNCGPLSLPEQRITSCP